MKKLRKIKLPFHKLKEKKGMSTLEFVICFMLFLTVFNFLADMMLICYKQYVVTSACTEMVRQIGTQGGISNTVPINYPGLDRNYLTYKEINAWIDDLNSTYYLEADEVYAEISYYTDPGNPDSMVTYNTKDTKTTLYLPYGSYVSLTVYYPVNWQYISIASGKDVRSMFSVTKEYVTDYVSWVPEDYTISVSP